MSSETTHHFDQGAGSVAAARLDYQQAGGGAIPTPALQSQLLFRPKDIKVRPVAHGIARQICETKHYLKSYPGGSLLAFGVFVQSSLLGVAVLGVGPTNVHRLFQRTDPRRVACLSRFWLDDRLGRNCESRALAIILRHLKRDQEVIKALVAYSDPLAGHNGAIYRAAGFWYLGLSTAMPRYRLPDGRDYHSRSLSHAYGTHSLKHFKDHGIEIQLVEQSPKHTYVALVDTSWQERLLVAPLAYPKSEL
jgi:hypothetical protein